MQFDEAHQYAEDNGLIHMETSAKSAQNVKSIFVEIGEGVVFVRHVASRACALTLFLCHGGLGG